MVNLYNNCSNCKNKSICKYCGATEKAKESIKNIEGINSLRIEISCDNYVRENDLNTYDRILNSVTYEGRPIE